jgi:hypothetical protein
VDKPLINVADAPIHHGESGEHFQYSMTELAGTLGARAIGVNVTRVLPEVVGYPDSRKTGERVRDIVSRHR